MLKPEIFNYSKEDKKLIADAIRNLVDDGDYLEWYNLSIKNQDAIEFLIKSDIAMRDRVNFFNHYADLIDFYEIEPEFEIIRHKSIGFYGWRNINAIRIYYKYWKENPDKLIFLYPSVCPEMRQLIEKDGGRFTSSLLGYYYMDFPFDEYGKKIDYKFDFFCNVSRYIDMDYYNDLSNVGGHRTVYSSSISLWGVYFYCINNNKLYNKEQISVTKISKIFNYTYKLLELIYDGIHNIDLNNSYIVNVACILADTDDKIVEDVFNQFFSIKDIIGNESFYLNYFLDDYEFRKNAGTHWWMPGFLCFFRIVVSNYKELYIDPINVKEKLKNKTINNISCAIVELYYRPVNFPRSLWSDPFDVYYCYFANEYNTQKFEESFLVHLLSDKKIESFKGTTDYPIEISPEIAKKMTEYFDTKRAGHDIPSIFYNSFGEGLNISKYVLDAANKDNALARDFPKDFNFILNLWNRLDKDEKLKNHKELIIIADYLRRQYWSDKAAFTFDLYSTEHLINESIKETERLNKSSEDSFNGLDIFDKNGRVIKVNWIK